jgi:hypothetical protein
LALSDSYVELPLSIFKMGQEYIRS